MMIDVYDVMKWLRLSSVYQERFVSSYCGKLDNKQEKSLGVYPLKSSGQPYRAFEGRESYETIGISLLIHFNRNVEQSQTAANLVFQFLRTYAPYRNLPPIKENCKVHHIELRSPEPIFVGTDDSGIFEFVIEFKLYYSEKENDNG